MEIKTHTTAQPASMLASSAFTNSPAVVGEPQNPTGETTPPLGTVAASTATESVSGGGSQGENSYWVVGEILDGKPYYYCESPCRLFEEIEKATHFNLDYAARLAKETKVKGICFIRCVTPVPAPVIPSPSPSPAPAPVAPVSTLRLHWVKGQRGFISAASYYGDFETGMDWVIGKAWNKYFLTFGDSHVLGKFDSLCEAKQFATDSESKGKDYIQRLVDTAEEEYMVATSKKEAI